MGVVTQQLALAAAKAGATLQRGKGISSIVVDKGQACGVVTAEGREHSARAVVANCDPFRLRQLAGRDKFPPAFSSWLDERLRDGTTMKAREGGEGQGCLEVWVTCAPGLFDAHCSKVQVGGVHWCTCPPPGGAEAWLVAPVAAALAPGCWLCHHRLLAVAGWSPLASAAGQPSSQRCGCPSPLLQVNLALSALPKFSCLPEAQGQHRATIHLLPGEDDVLRQVMQASLKPVASGAGVLVQGPPRALPLSAPTTHRELALAALLPPPAVAACHTYRRMLK